MRRSENGERVLENVQNTRLWVALNNASWCAILDRWSLLRMPGARLRVFGPGPDPPRHPAASPKVAGLSLALAQCGTAVPCRLL